MRLPEVDAISCRGQTGNTHQVTIWTSSYIQVIHDTRNLGAAETLESRLACVWAGGWVGGRVMVVEGVKGGGGVDQGSSCCL
jgi:hypothetical protein